ncbi:MAG TPA: S-adenosylmethionine:tRNA ribosyltransferase-isomerase [Chitinophagaceae bacterium]|jgi:S-adenosylmethionine:tRNA ribosyltransferase-isomerase|nr:S-adenosylmethionine:tRNA ribosyltransferase-isomerase [Chitinophagaceae bacterium]
MKNFNISIRNFSYSLPENRIANYPLAERDASKLLIYRDGNISEDVYRNITEYIPRNALLVFNNTKVIEARLLFQKPTGGVIEIFCLEPHEQYHDITTAMAQKEKVWWNCLVGGASKWKAGQVLEKKIGDTLLFAKYIEKENGKFIIELSWSPAHLPFAEILHQAGAIPLPPYIKREAEESDKERYQTVYAGKHGSVAAPTAGLHFTPAIFTQLKEKNIQTAFVTLHVGAGTFKPVKSETMQEHEMHAEWIDVSKKTIIAIIENLENPVIAVGTTSLRTIESLYWMGVKIRESTIANRQSLYLSQWEAYELAEKNTPVKDALYSLLEWMNSINMEQLVTKTQILIAPGYEFKIVKGLVTNFHQPQSTLLLLVAALIGDDWKKIYDHALQNDFRFLSYGDGCLLWQREAVSC